MVIPVQIPNLPLGVVTFPNGKAMNLSVGFGSGAFRNPSDAQGRIWLLTDRGPNIDCADSKRLIGLDIEQTCAGKGSGRIYPLAGFAPSIYGVDIGPDNVARINVFIPLKGKSGRPVSGRPTPAPNTIPSETAFGLDGKPLSPDPSGVDPEGFVRLSDGTFWVAEEFGPSLLEIGADGTIRRRLVPANAAADFKDADYDIHVILPPITRLRGLNRGFKGLAVSPDEKHLYAVMQSPLANPDSEALRNSRALRIWKIERESGLVAGQYLYVLDEPRAFRADNDGRERTQSSVGVSELVAIGEDHLLVVERVEKTARLFTVTLRPENRIPEPFDLPEIRPTLEKSGIETLRERGILPLDKTLVLDTDTAGGIPAKIEGVAIVAPNELILVNESDSGIDGVRSLMFRVILPTPLLR